MEKEVDVYWNNMLLLGEKARLKGFKAPETEEYSKFFLFTHLSFSEGLA